MKKSVVQFSFQILPFMCDYYVSPLQGNEYFVTKKALATQEVKIQ